MQCSPYNVLLYTYIEYSFESRSMTPECSKKCIFPNSWLQLRTYGSSSILLMSMMKSFPIHEQYSFPFVGVQSIAQAVDTRRHNKYNGKRFMVHMLQLYDDSHAVR